MMDPSSCIFHVDRGPVRRLCAAAEAAAGTCPRGAAAACTCRPHHMHPRPGELQHVCHPGRPGSSPDLAAPTTATSTAHCIQVDYPLLLHPWALFRVHLIISLVLLAVWTGRPHSVTI